MTRTTTTVEADREATRARICDAALRCIERWGLGKTSVEDVATAARISRATVYRYFPGGRDELIRETVAGEVQCFFERLGCALADDEGIEAKLVHGLVVGHRALDDHRLLQQVLSTDREALLAEFAELAPMLVDEVRNELASVLVGERLRAGIDVPAAADYLARLFLSYLTTSGGHDLSDREAVGRLVRTFFVGGILEPTER